MRVEVVRLSVVEKQKRLQVMSSPVCADPESLPRDGPGWSGMVRDGSGWSGMVRDCPGWASDVGERFGAVVMTVADDQSSRK